MSAWSDRYHAFVTSSEGAWDRSCPFCDLARGLGRAPETIAATPEWIAFFPDTPATPGHTLVIPRVHIPDLWAASCEIAAALMDGVVRVGHAINEALSPEGMNLISSAGWAAEQSIPHLHLHVVPRWHDDKIDRIWPPKEFMPRPISREIAQAMRAAFSKRVPPTKP